MNFLSFSLGDAQLAAEYGLSELRAVTGLFRHSLSGAWPAVEDLNRLYAEELPKAEAEVAELVKAGDLAIIHYGYEVRHRIWVRVAFRAGLDYRREKT